MNDAVIVSGVRTPIGAFGGVFSDYPATSLAAVAIREAVERAGLTNLREGQKVEFELTPGRDGRASAENLVVLD